MNTIGWIRYGDKAACGGVVVEGSTTEISHGRPLAYYGARMACRKHCVIMEAHPCFTLSNGRQVPHHGHITTNGCPLESTLNDIHGWLNESGSAIPIRFAKDAEGEWVGKHNEGYDQIFHLTDDVTGEPLANRHYRMTFNGEVIEGKTDNEGRTSKVIADDPGEVQIEIFPEGYDGSGA